MAQAMSTVVSCSFQEYACSFSIHAHNKDVGCILELGYGNMKLVHCSCLTILWLSNFCHIALWHLDLDCTML